MDGWKVRLDDVRQQQVLGLGDTDGAAGQWLQGIQQRAGSFRRFVTERNAYADGMQSVLLLGQDVRLSPRFVADGCHHWGHRGCWAWNVI